MHLLLAFPLFVVVVGVDSRWLLRSLHHHYADLMQSHETPQNYLEKIFQISLCLPPMTQQGYADLVTADLLPEFVSPEPTTGSGADEIEQAKAASPQGGPDDVPQQTDDESPPVQAAQAPSEVRRVSTRVQRQRVLARALRLKPDERQLIIDAHPLIGTPRSAKRLVNVYRLLRAGLPPHERDQFAQGEFRAVIVLLGILVGFPLQGARLLEALPSYSGPTLLELLDANGDGWATIALAVRQIGATTDIPQDAGTYARWAPKVARYSFRTGHLFNG
ncbi:hypothetical protein GCM10027569_08410 [Flindersiella endophytica]